MRKFTVTIMAIVFAITCVEAQVKLQFGDDLTVSPYVGILGGAAFSVDSLSTGGFTNVRIGALGNYSPTKWMGFTTRALYQGDGNGSFHGATFNIDLKPVKSLHFRVGSMASLSCLQRPDPISATGQFETWSESQIPGPALGADLRWNYAGKDGDIGVGVYERNGFEYQGRIHYKKLAVSGSYHENGHWSTQASWKGDIVYSALVVQDTVVANISVVNIGSFSIYNDIGFYHQSDEMPRWEIGLLKNFAHAKYPASGLGGIGYAHETKSVMVYLFLHLTPKPKQ